MLMIAVLIGRSVALTLKGQHLRGLDHDGELQHQLRGAFQEGLEQTQHADISTLEHHAPVVVAPLGIPVPSTLHTQVQGVDVPEDTNTETCVNALLEKVRFFLILGLNTVLQKLLDIKHRLSEVTTHYSKLWELSVVLAKKLVTRSFGI